MCPPRRDKTKRCRAEATQSLKRQSEETYTPRGIHYEYLYRRVHERGRPTRLLAKMLVDSRLAPLEVMTLNMAGRLVMPDRDGVLQVLPLWKAEAIKERIMKRARLAPQGKDTHGSERTTKVTETEKQEEKQQEQSNKRSTEETKTTQTEETETTQDTMYTELKMAWEQNEEKVNTTAFLAVMKYVIHNETSNKEEYKKQYETFKEKIFGAGFEEDIRKTNN